jgi:hypothetical protein
VTKGQRAHLARVLEDHSGLIQRKYKAGQKEHGGNCWEKPGMLAHAMDEAADLPVYLHTLAEQMTALIAKLRDGRVTRDEAADEIYRWLTK